MLAISESKFVLGKSKVVLAIFLLLLPPSSLSLENGLALTPPMGELAHCSQYPLRWYLHPLRQYLHPLTLSQYLHQHNQYHKNHHQHNALIVSKIDK